MPQTTPEEQQAYTNARSQLQQHAEDVDILRALFALFGRSPV